MKQPYRRYFYPFSVVIVYSYCVHLLLHSLGKLLESVMVIPLRWCITAKVKRSGYTGSIAQRRGRPLVNEQNS